MLLIKKTKLFLSATILFVLVLPGGVSALSNYSYVSPLDGKTYTRDNEAWKAYPNRYSNSWSIAYWTEPSNQGGTAMYSCTCPGGCIPTTPTCPSTCSCGKTVSAFWTISIYNNQAAKPGENVRADISITPNTTNYTTELFMDYSLDDGVTWKTLVPRQLITGTKYLTAYFTAPNTPPYNPNGYVKVRTRMLDRYIHIISMGTPMQRWSHDEHYVPYKLYGYECKTATANSCGVYGVGVMQPTGICSVTTPPASTLGLPCISPANSCGVTTPGTKNCQGICSVTTAPPLPVNYQQSCSSVANACGQTVQGTIGCNGTCSAVTPALPIGYGTSCTSAANSCGTVNSGTIGCDGKCSATAPANPVNYGKSCVPAANACGMTAAVGTVKSVQKISQSSGGLGNILNSGDGFGISVAGIGDLNRDGISDMVAGSYGDNYGVNSNSGAVYILFLNSNGTVKSYQKIAQNLGGLGNILGGADVFGTSVASIGDINGDGIADIAVGAPGLGSTQTGSVYILFLNTNGTVKSVQKISQNIGGLGNILSLGDYFGEAVSSIGDLNNDGITDIAVGVPGDGTNGAIHLLFLNSNGTVKSSQKFVAPEGLFSFFFGAAVAAVGDLNGDNINDIAVGSYGDSNKYGAMYILFLNSNGTIKSYQKISQGSGGLGNILAKNDQFGTWSITSSGDMDNDGVPDIVVGAPGDSDGDAGSGSVYLLMMAQGGTVKSYKKISQLSGELGNILNSGDQFGWSVSSIGDINRDGVVDIAVGSDLNDDVDSNSGAVYVLSLNSAGSVGCDGVTCSSLAPVDSLCGLDIGLRIKSPAQAAPKIIWVEPSTALKSPLRIYKGGQIYGVKLTPDFGLRIKTPTGIIP